jgi:hypothetical protein
MGDFLPALETLLLLAGGYVRGLPARSCTGVAVIAPIIVPQSIAAATKC